WPGSLRVSPRTSSAAEVPISGLKAARMPMRMIGSVSAQFGSPCKVAIREAFKSLCMRST
ncbi:hypothetical protein M514_10283, partial [Trichuris suis]